MNILKNIFNRAAESARTERASQGLTVRHGVGLLKPSSDEADDVVRREIKGTVLPKPPAKLFEKFGRQPIPLEIWRLVCGGADLTSERTALQKVCEEARGLREFRAAHSPDKALAAADAHSQAMADRLARGDFEGITSTDARGKDEIRKEFKRVSEQAYFALCALSKKAAPVCEQIAEKLSRSANAAATRLEAEERATAARFGVEFRPSGQLVAIGQASWRTVEILPVPGTSDSPDRLLALISE